MIRIVEVISPGNKDYNLIKKNELYERLGVKEYWMVDPQTKEVFGFEWSENKYQRFEGTGIINSPMLNLRINMPMSD